MKIGEKDSWGRVCNAKKRRTIFCKKCGDKFTARVAVDIWGNILEQPAYCWRCEEIANNYKYENNIFNS